MAGFKLLRGRVVDITPDQFSITAKTGQALGSAISSAAVTPVGYTSPATLTVTNGLVSINGATAVAGPVTISPGDNFIAVNTSSGSYNTLTTTTISISGVSAAFNVTTQAFVPPGAITFRSSETQVVDVESIIALFRDTPYSSDRITVTNNGADLTVHLWNLSGLNGTLDLAQGESFDCVGSDLDYLLISTSGMADADVQSVTFDGVDSGGSPVTQDISIVCANDPATIQWSMGAKTRGMFGGFPIHQYLQGNPQHWSIKTPDPTVSMMIIYDATSRTETNVGAGITYANGYARLVLVGTTGVTQVIPNSIWKQNDNATFTSYNNSVGHIWDNYGGAPATAPTPATTSTVVLQNSDGLPDRTVVITWVANQVDVAPWPLLDQYTNSADTPTHQPGWVARQGAAAGLTFGYTWMWEQGEHLFGGKSWQIGFLVNFGSTTIAGTAPTGLFNVGSGRYTAVTDPLVYTEGATYNANLITWRARTPLTWFDQPRGINAVSINVATNSTVGIRMTGFAMGSGPGIAAGNNVKFAGMDHCSCKRNDGLVSSHDVGSNVTQGSFYLHNLYNQASVSGSDSQRWGNLCQGILWGTPTSGNPGSNVLTNSGVNLGQPYGGVDNMKMGPNRWNSDTTYRAQDCFDYQFNPVCADDYGHWDYEQWVANGTSTTAHEGPTVVAKLMWCGTGRNSTGFWSSRPFDTGKMLPGRNEGYFHSPSNFFTGWIHYRIAGMLLMDRQVSGVDLAKSGRDTRFVYNGLFIPTYVPPQGLFTGTIGGAPGPTPPEFSAEVPASEDFASYLVAHNIFCSGLGGGDNSTYTANQTQVRSGGSGSALLAKMNDFASDPGLCDNIQDVIDKMGYIPGQEVDAGPFAPAVLAGLIDYRRRIYDGATLFA